MSSNRGTHNLFVYLCVYNYWGFQEDSKQHLTVCPSLEPMEKQKLESDRRRSDVLQILKKPRGGCGVVFSPLPAAQLTGRAAQSGTEQATLVLPLEHPHPWARPLQAGGQRRVERICA